MRRTKRGATWLRGLIYLVALWFMAACGGADAQYADSPRAERSYGGTTVSADSSDDDMSFGLGEGDAEPMMAPMADASRGPGDMPGEAPPPPPAPAPRQAPPTATDGTKSKPPSTGPLLIYTANYTMAVYEVTQSIDGVQALAKKMGGYLVKRTDRAITIRVPAKKYQEVLGSLSKLGDVVHREETVEDVTEQFFDMKTRLDNAKAMRIRLQELLAAAKDVTDALAVEKELARVTETIERMEGKLKRLRELINFSTITVNFNPRGGENVNSNVNLPFSWLSQLGLGPLLRLR